MSYTITVNFEIQGGITSQMPLAKYVRTLDTNPVSIEEGGMATLDFVADGMYYTLLKAKALAAKVTGASFTWSCPEPYTYGKMILSNPTDNVVITLRAKVNVLPQEVTRPFLIKGQFPIDTRLILSKKEMLEIDDLAMPETYFALCKEEGHFYIYNKNNELNAETGKFKLAADSLNDQIDLSEVFLIQDPTHNQILIYDKNTEKWVNRDLTDEESIIYLDNESQGLSIKGYKEASQGYMLVKDSEKGLSWIKPLSTDQLQTYTSAAYDSAQKAGSSAVNAGNAAVKAEKIDCEVTKKITFTTDTGKCKIRIIENNIFHKYLKDNFNDLSRLRNFRRTNKL